MDDLISRQAAISAICNACGKIDCDKMDKCEKLQLPPANCSEFPNNSDIISRQAAIVALDKHLQTTDVPVSYPGIISALTEWLNEVPSAQPQTEWNNHTVACLLAELFGDACACNYNGIDEWLPEKCEVIDACPNPVGVACWEQFLTHRAERRTDD